MEQRRTFSTTAHFSPRRREKMTKADYKNEMPTQSVNGNLLEIYRQLNTGYHAVDDFRAKLLGFLPLASGAAFLALFEESKAKGIGPYLRETGVLGVLIALGLLIYELKGIQKCTCFIHYGGAIEKKLLGESFSEGKFIGLKDYKKGWRFATEPVASAIVYATVMAGWVYVATCSRPNENVAFSGNVWLAVTVGLIVCLIVIVFWLYCGEHGPWGKQKDIPKD
jgi:hypothetical protein